VDLRQEGDRQKNSSLCPGGYFGQLTDTKWPFYFSALTINQILFPGPFFYHVLHSWVNGISDPFGWITQKMQDTIFKSKLVENIVGGHLIAIPGALFFWRNSYEIDFILSPVESKPVYMEVKYQSRVNNEDVKGLEKAGGGILLSYDSLTQRENNVIDIPLHLFLALIRQ
jgi:predicted AAA+ superfamily ATPase